MDPSKDQSLQDQIEAAYQTVLFEERKRNPDRTLIQAKRKEMERLRLEVQKIYVSQAFSSQLGKNGAVRVNAFTSKDETQYFMSVPSDMLNNGFPSSASSSLSRRGGSSMLKKKSSSASGLSVT